MPSSVARFSGLQTKNAEDSDLTGEEFLLGDLEVSVCDYFVLVAVGLLCYEEACSPEACLHDLHAV
jgi:hypothetical protein